MYVGLYFAKENFCSTFNRGTKLVSKVRIKYAVVNRTSYFKRCWLKDFKLHHIIMMKRCSKLSFDLAIVMWIEWLEGSGFDVAFNQEGKVRGRGDWLNEPKIHFADSAKATAIIPRLKKGDVLSNVSKKNNFPQFSNHPLGVRGQTESVRKRERSVE